jgi:hypothetical protein
MRTMIAFAALLPLFAGGCVHTVTSVATAPFKVAGKAVDWTTTSQSEADRNYGRKMRKQEAREGKERKKAYKQCRHEGGSEAECRANYQGYRAGGYQQ